MKTWYKLGNSLLWTITIIFVLIGLIMLGQKTSNNSFIGNGYQYISKNGFAETFKLGNYKEFSYDTSELSYIGSALQLISVAVPIFIIISASFTIYSLYKIKNNE